jgi:acetoin utilization deacetylase AcuC-like enzyme
MISIFPKEHSLHNPPHELLDGILLPPYESPERASLILAAVEQANLGPVIAPRDFGMEPIRAIHSAEYLRYLETIYERWVAAGGSPLAVLPEALAVRWMNRPSDHPKAAPGYFSFDMSAPIVAGTYPAIVASANTALTGAALLLEGQRSAYALCRPPGHHAGSDLCGGYCFLNNAAIAANYLLNHAPARRVAILDIDYHHGNGTQQIFYERDDVLFVSIHADPSVDYPYFLGHADEQGAGAGKGFNLNLPLGEGTGDEEYLATLDLALMTIREYEPEFLVVSAGFDTFDGDPLGLFHLSAAAFPEIGRRIAQLQAPTLIVQEGGYAISALGENVVALLRGFEQQ